MMHIQKTAPTSLLLFLACTTFFVTQKSVAEILASTQVDSELIDPLAPLTAQRTLTSLKNLKPSGAYQAPFVQELTNSKQIRSLFVSSQDLPIIDIQLTFNAGSAQDEQMGKGLFGTSNMAAKLIMEGTDTYNANQLIDTFNALGAKFTVQAYRDMFVVRLRVLSEASKREPAINLMLHVLNHATFNDSGLKLVLNNTQVGQKQIQENPNRLMSIQFYRALYGRHPYAEPSVGTNGSIKKITPELLVKFKQQFLVAQNSNIAITGNLNQTEATQIVEKITAGLLQGQKAADLPEPIEHTDFKVSFIPTRSEQAYVTLGHLAIDHDNPDRIALELANQIFGSGSFNSLLSKELRIKRGFTYHAASSLSAMQSRGVFSLSYSTQQKQLMQSIQIAHQTLNDFIQKPLNARQLQETKEGMLRAFPMTFSSNASINAQIASIGFYGLATDYLSQYQKTLNALSTQDVERAIRKHLHADRLTIVIVAKELDQKQLIEMLNQNISDIQPNRKLAP